MLTRRALISMAMPVAAIGLGLVGCGEAFNPIDPSYKGYVIEVEGMS